MQHDEREQQTINTIKMFFGKTLNKTARTALERNRFTSQEILQYWMTYTLELSNEIRRLKTENARLTAESDSLKQADLLFSL